MIVRSQTSFMSFPIHFSVAVLLGIAVHNSNAYLPSGLSDRRFAPAIVRDVDVRTGITQGLLLPLTSRTRGSGAGSTKTELASILGPRRRHFSRAWDHGERTDSRPDTSLSMGLRDGFKWGKGRKGGDKKKFSSPGSRRIPFETDSSPVERHTPRNGAPYNGSGGPVNVPEPRPIRMGEIPGTREVDATSLDEEESVQERINRVKAGQMTPEEKKAFLESALTAGPTIEARLPIRKPKKETNPASASPFPKDSIIREIASGGKPINNNNNNEKPSIVDSQQRKKEYLEMVTGPDRFKPYRSVTPTTPPPVENGTRAPANEILEDDSSPFVTPPDAPRPPVSQVSSSTYRSPMDVMRPPPPPPVRPRFEPQLPAGTPPPRYQPHLPHGKSKSLYQPQSEPRPFQPQKTTTDGPSSFQPQRAVAAPFDPQYRSPPSPFDPQHRPPPAPFQPQRPVGAPAAPLNDAAGMTPDAPGAPPAQSLSPHDLGTRLGMAAMQTESQRQQVALKAEEERKEREREQEIARQEFERQAAELARQKQQEMAEREIAMREQRRREEEELARKQEIEKKREEERMAELMKAQDDFWTRKLANEKAKKAEAWGRKLEEPPVMPIVEVEEEEEELPEVEMIEDSSVDIAAPDPTVQSRAFNPDEKYLIEEAQESRNEAWNHNQEVIADQVSRINGYPYNDVYQQSEPSFMEDQGRRKKNMDHVRDEQLAKLRALSSPLPSPAVKPRSRAPAPSPAFQPQRVGGVNGYPSNFRPQKPVSPPVSLHGSPLDSLHTTDEEGEDELETVDRQKTIRELQSEDDEEEEDEEPTQNQGGWGGFFGGGGGGNNDKNKKKSTAKPAKTGGPIRMQLPLDDEDDTSVPDVKSAMQRANERGASNQDDRSKKWGIDMSKFSD